MRQFLPLPERRGKDMFLLKVKWTKFKRTTPKNQSSVSFLIQGQFCAPDPQVGWPTPWFGLRQRSFWMFSFCIAAITNKWCKFITLQFWSQKSPLVKIKVLGSCCFHRFSGRFYFLPFSASRSWLHSLANGPLLSSKLVIAPLWS